MPSPKMTLVIAFALLAASESAMAGDAHVHGDEAKGMSCGMMDMGKMSAEARKAKMDEIFAKLDADKDGNISRAEFDRHHEDMMTMMETQRPKAHDHVEEHN